MKYFRQLNKRTLLILSLILSFSLLCAQEVNLHIHDLEHNNKQGHLYASNAESAHNQISLVHLSHDTPHGDHHDREISDIDISPTGVLKNNKFHLFYLALITFIFILVIGLPSLLLLLFRRKSELVFYLRYILSPPLRAPPHH